LRRSFVSLALATSILAVTSSTPARAELVVPAGWVALGGGVAWPPAELGFGHDGVNSVLPTFGGIVGVRLIPELAIEARGNWMTTSDLNNLDILHGEGNLTAFVAPESHFVPLITAGGGGVRIHDDAGSDSKGAWNAGGGFLWRFNDQVGLRVDARYISYKVMDAKADDSFRPHTEIFAGLNIGFGGTLKDTDGDGVPDRNDYCADTPLGARVDLTGCPIDSDHDGVPDGIDQCDATPPGAKVDTKGCPIDSDGDGVYDGIDTCPNTPAHAVVDAAGCPIDSDGDGVFDGLDQCEGTPKGCTVNASGCTTDSDQDGVCDGLDQCPDTPIDVKVDANGCPIQVTEKETELLETGMIRLQNINFDSGTATLKPESYPSLDEVGNILKKWPALRIEIGGHTDSQGSEEFNQKLSEDRAKAVLNYLLDKFPALNPEQITSVGYGETKPIAPNDTAFNRAKNRRVEFRVLNKEALRKETEKTKLVPKE
jgi:outer membrane protein OmpA-like peptidoglycan-associated protein